MADRSYRKRPELRSVLGVPYQRASGLSNASHKAPTVRSTLRWKRSRPAAFGLGEPVFPRASSSRLTREPPDPETRSTSKLVVVSAIPPRTSMHVKRGLHRAQRMLYETAARAGSPLK